MSKAYKCDRCGKFYDKKLRSDKTIKFNFMDGLNDLPGCLDEFCMWYNMKE